MVTIGIGLLALGWFLFLGLKEIARAINPRYEEDYEESI